MNDFESERKDPDFCIGGFALWISGRQFPESDEYWDGNWLDVIARCSSNSSMVQAAGAFVHLSELHDFLEGCKEIYDTLSGVAKLECMEPNLGLKIEMEKTGHLQLTVSITPDNLTEDHSFLFALDQSHLPPLIKSLEKIFDLYPIQNE